MKGRFWMLLTAVFLVIAAVGILSSESARRSDFTSDLSTHSAAPKGGRALFVLCKKLGLNPVRRAKNLEHIPEKGTLVSIKPSPRVSPFLAILAGFDVFSDREKEVVQRWVREGNTMVLVAPSPGGMAEGFGLELASEPSLNTDTDEGKLAPKQATWPPIWEASSAFLNDGSFPGVRALHTEEVLPGIALKKAWDGDDEERPDLFTSASEGYSPLFVTAEGKTVVAEVRYGGGRFVWVASAFMASNKGLREGDNALFLTHLLRDPRGLYFDEYHHGFDNERSLSGYLRTSGLWVVVCQLALLLLLAAWRAQKRFGGVLPFYEGESRGTVDQITAMSRIYLRGGHTDHALKILLEDMDRSLAKHFQCPRHLRGEALFKALEDRGHGALAGRARSLHRRAGIGGGGRASEDQVIVEWSRDVAEFMASLRSNRGRSER